MKGRITSVVRNEHGVSYRELLEKERAATDRLIEAYRAALEAWEQANSPSCYGKERKRLLRRAQALTRRVLA